MRGRGGQIGLDFVGQLKTHSRISVCIEQRAKREGAEIHWGDETALTNTDVRGRSYAPVGKTPVALRLWAAHAKNSP